MKAKPSKCISMAMKRFDPRTKKEVFCPVYDDKQYSPFDPGLMIDGQKMAFILDPNLKVKDIDKEWKIEKDDPDLDADKNMKREEKKFDKSKFEKSHFKFLGRWIHFFVKEEGVLSRIVNNFNDMETVDKSLVLGTMKAWLYQFYVLPRLSWSFMVHDLNIVLLKPSQHLLPLY
jgi:hypothetical protein